MSVNITATLTRFKKQSHPEKQTLGTLTLYDEWTCELITVKTLELPFKNNQRNISNIPAGVYDVVVRYSKKYSWHFHVTDVEDRTWILIHQGNYYYQIRGCILVGKAFIDLNGDGVKDVTSSKSTKRELLKLAPEGFKLTIKEEE